LETLGEKTLQPVHGQVESLIQAVSVAPQSLLLLDYDGTLAPFRTRRQEALPYPGLTKVLDELISQPRTRVVVISGRRAEEIPKLLRMRDPFEIWGLHGLERLRTDGSLDTVPVGRESVAALEDAAAWLQSQRLAGHAEEKYGSIAVHWRGLGPTVIDDIRQRLLLGWDPIARQVGLELLDFDGGLEIRVPGANKGHAVRTLLSERAPGTPVAYLGDDWTDEDAFLALRKSGVGILVRETNRPTAAEVWLRPPTELIAFLEAWLAASKGR
jgi:trehalose-phosphatase